VTPLLTYNCRTIETQATAARQQEELPPQPPSSEDEPPTSQRSQALSPQLLPAHPVATVPRSRNRGQNRSVVPIKQNHIVTIVPRSRNKRFAGRTLLVIVLCLVLLASLVGGGIWTILKQQQPRPVSNGSAPSDSQHATATALTSSPWWLDQPPGPSDSLNATATALANINPYVPGPSTLVMGDPLSRNNQTAQWQENPQGGCHFTDSSYRASAAPNVFTSCFATGTNYTNFAYQIQMVFIQHAPKYSSGGILFRGSTDQRAFYSFEVYASGRYIFQKCNNGKPNCTLLAGSSQDPPSSAFQVDQMNTLAVVANQNTFTLYINQKPIGSHQTDNSSPYVRGLIGVLVHGGQGSDTPTQVAYSNIKVWQ